MPDALLQISNLTKRFGGLTVTDNLDLEVVAGTTHAIIGPNGAGKTTLINQIQGEIAPDLGRIVLDGRDISRLPTARRARLGIARTFQLTSIFPEFSVLANVALAVQAHQGHSFRFWKDATRDPALLDPSRQILKSGRPRWACRRFGSEVLSHGERRQLELALALAGEPILLVLDEPMAGMGQADSTRMTALLSGLQRRYTILLVEHDMDAVFKLADRITVLVGGRNIATGGAGEIRGDADVQAAYLGHSS